jgi:hypothetical protein
MVYVIEWSVTVLNMLWFTRIFSKTWHVNYYILSSTVSYAEYILNIILHNITDKNFPNLQRKSL